MQTITQGNCLTGLTSDKIAGEVTIMTETTQRTFNSSGAVNKRTITVITNGGSVTIEASEDGGSFQLTDTISLDGGYPLFQGRAMLRITPFGGAEYEFI